MPLSFGSYSTLPDANISCNGVNIAENCAAGNLNNVVRQLMADGRELYDIVSAISVSNYMPLTGGSFTGSITRSGAGAYPYYGSSSLVGGRITVQSSSASLPSSPVEGDIVFQFAA